MPSMPLFSGVTRFSVLSPADLEQLAERSSAMMLKAGERIFREGADCLFLYALVAGFVKLSRQMDGTGREVLLQVLGAGSLFDEPVVLQSGTHFCTATALTACHVIRILRADYLGLLRRHPRFMDSSLSSIARNAAIFRENLLTLHEDRVEARLSRFLIALADGHGREEPEGIRIPFYLSRGELASAVNARRETVIRQMSRWEKDEVVYPIGKNSLLIAAVEKLKAAR